MAMKLVATLPRELAEHWRNVLADAGLDCSLEGPSDEVQLLVPEDELARAQELFEPPFEGEEEGLPEGEGPALAADERTEPLVNTEQVLIADRLTRALHEAGLFAAIQSGTTSSVFGAEGPPHFTIVVAASTKHRAVEVAKAWAEAHVNDFTTEEQVDLKDLIRAWAVMVGAPR